MPVQLDPARCSELAKCMVFLANVEGGPSWHCCVLFIMKSDYEAPNAKRQRVSEGMADNVDKDAIIASLRTEIEQLKASEYKLKHQVVTELKKRESALVMRLSTKEQDIHELQSQVSDLIQALNTSMLSKQRQTLLDPAVNLSFQKLKEELAEKDKRVKELQDELDAVQFTAQSISGKRLLTKCKLLQEENEEFGHLLSEEKIHRLENELALQKELTEELKKSLSDAHEYVAQLDEEVENLQKEFLSLKQQNKEKKDSTDTQT